MARRGRLAGWLHVLAGTTEAAHSRQRCAAPASPNLACPQPPSSLAARSPSTPLPLPQQYPAVDSAKIQTIDRLGMTVVCERAGDALKARLPFPSPATDRKSVKDRIVEMTQASAAALQAAPAAAGAK